MATPQGAPLVKIIEVPIVAQIAAGTADHAIGDVEIDCTVTSVEFTPDAAITGATATKRTFTLENRGAAGAGTTVVATLDFITGVNATKHDAKVFTLSATAADLNLTAGDTLAVKEVVTSTGTANPGGTIEVTASRR